MNKAKRLIALFLCLLTLGALCTLLGACGSSDTVTLNVYNWGEYISDGSEDSLDVNKAFEEYYFETYGKRVKVNYTTYASNEDMYAKLRSGSTSYDIIIPSDYMVQRLIAEDMVEPLNPENIPNAAQIADEFRGLFYDPDDRYSIPYSYGMIGVIYNTKMVDSADIGSWSLLWNEKYRGKILQINNARDAFGTAMYYLGIDVNTTDRADWEAALQYLKDQKPLVQGYVMDEIFNKMKGESAAIAPYYAGDYLTMYDSNDALGFFYPSEGTNVFVDAFCIPKGTRHKDIAEAYINFMLSEEPAVANAEYIGYACPNTVVRESEEYQEYLADIHPDAYDILYPDLSDLYTSYYHALDNTTQQIENELWESLKIESSVGGGIYLLALVIVAAAVALGIVRFAIRRRRAYYLKSAERTDTPAADSRA